MKLQTKIQLFSSLFMFLLLLLVNTSVYYLFQHTSLKNELNELSVQTDTIIETLNKNPTIPKNELLHAFLPTNGMIRVFQSSNELLIPTLTKKDEYRELPGEFSNKEIRDIIKHSSHVKVASISKPMIWETGEVVTIQAVNFLDAQKETMKQLMYVLIIASIFMLIPTYIAATMLSRFLLNPIKTLIETMRKNTKQSNWEKINTQNRSKDELYEMEQTFNEMIDHLKGSYERQQMFVSDASHELKTPISIVKSYAQLLKRRGKDYPEVFDESVEAIDSEADRMQKLVEQMLLLAKNKNDMEREEIDLRRLCNNVVTKFRGAYKRSIVLETEVDKLLVNGNIDQLEQIIYILLDNALKYSGSKVEIMLHEENNHALVQVRDYGQGISKQDLSLVFERFYRIDKARHRKTGGTGLGLPIAKSIAASHGGTITVQSKVNEGSTFTLTLPLSKV